MINRANKFVLLVALSLSLLCSCTSSKSSTNEVADTVSLTFSEYATEGTGSDINTQIYNYDCTTKEIQKIFEFEYTSQYPLGVYDKKNNEVYYTKGVEIDENTHGDQIFITDLSTNTEKQLTDDLFAVNYIIPAEHTIFFVARPKGSEILKLGSINKKTGQIYYWGDEDKNIEAITVNQKNEKIYLSSNSEKEVRYNLIHQEGPIGEDNFKMPKHTVFQTNYDFTETKELFSDNLWIRTVMFEGNNVVALCDKKHNNVDVPSLVYTYDLGSDTLTQKPWDHERMQVGDAGFSSDGKEIYAITVVDNKRGLFEYNVEEEQYTQLFTPEDGFINSIQVVRY